MAGIDHATNDVVVMIDADLQNDPADIPRLLAKLDEGYDVVSGWRKDRKDAQIRRNWISRVANRLISRVSGVRLNDYGCTLKAYRRSVVSDIRLYGEMHRFIPIYAQWQGARISELSVTHHARKFGQSKYGLERVFKVVLDLLVVVFLRNFFAKPIYLFGGCGIAAIILSFVTIGLALVMRIFFHVSLIQTPLPLLSALLFLVGMMSILMGLVAEMMVRTYYELQGARAYLVRELINFSRGPVEIRLRARSMCGIAGFWGAGDQTIVTAMTDALAHRGPDGLRLPHRRGQPHFPRSSPPCHHRYRRWRTADVERGSDRRRRFQR